MIGSGTQLDPWIPLNAAELKDCWSNRGGYIDLTCDIDMLDLVFGDPQQTPAVVLNLNGFNIVVRVVYGSKRLLSHNDNGSKITNGLITFIPMQNYNDVSINYGDGGSFIENVILINNSNIVVNVTAAGNGDRKNIICINNNINATSIGRYSGIYQSQLVSGKFFKKGEAKPSDIDTIGLPKDVFYIDNYLGGNNLRIEKKGKSFVAGVTKFNGNPVKMELTVVGSKSSAKWIAYSDDVGAFNINLGSYSDPVSIFASDIVNKKLRGNNSYIVGDVALAYPDNGVKFTCITGGVTGDLPNMLPSTGTVTLGTAVFEVKNISPSSCAGPMIPASKYSNYGIKSK